MPNLSGIRPDSFISSAVRFVSVQSARSAMRSVRRRAISSSWVEKMMHLLRECASSPSSSTSRYRWGRSIEQDIGSVLGQSAGYHDTLALAVAHAVHCAVGIILHIDGPKSIVNGQCIVFGESSDPVGVGGASHCHHIAAAEIRDSGTLRIYECQMPGHFRSTEVA